MKIREFFFGLLIAAALAGCEASPEQQEASAWRTAKSMGTQQAIQTFIEAWPDSDKIPAARRRLEVIAWKDSIKANSSQQYQSFLTNWPDGIFAPLAQEMLDWLQEHPDRSMADANLSLDFRFNLRMRTPEKTDSSRLSYLRSTEALLRCSGLTIDAPPGSPPADATLRIQVFGEGVEETYQFPGRDGKGPLDVPMKSGSRIHGELVWRSATRPEIRREFNHFDPPPDHAVSLTGDIDRLVDSMRYRSVSRSMEAKGSYWDRLVELVLARQGPRSYLCDASWDPTELAAHWSRALQTDDMPPLGPAVAALFSRESDRVRAAASKIAYSDAPYAAEYLERYLELSSVAPAPYAREYVELYLEGLRKKGQ